MKMRDIKIGQLVTYPSKDWTKTSSSYASRKKGDVGVVTHIYTDGRPRFSLRMLTEGQTSFEYRPVAIDVYWNSDNTLLCVEPEAIDLVSDVRQ